MRAPIHRAAAIHRAADGPQRQADPAATPRRRPGVNLGMNAPTKRARGRPRDEDLTAKRQDEILDAAIPIFARYGFRNTDVDRVASAIGVGKGTIYRYFPSKRELFLKAVDRGIRRLYERVDCAVEVTSDVMKQMESTVQTYLTFFDDHPEVVELVIQERAEFKDRKRQTYFEHRERQLERWRQRSAALIASGTCRDIPFEQMADFMNYVLYGAMFTNYFKGRDKSIAEQTREILDIVWFGTLSAGQRAQAKLPSLAEVRA
jgi:AcrR family transcriptional regulator